METQENATQILDKQMSDIQEKIIQAKINIADVFIKTTDVDVKNIKSPKDMIPLVEDMEKMPHYLSSVKENERILDALSKSRSEIEKAEIGYLVK